MQLIISLLVYNQLDITKRCIQSIIENTLTKNYLLVISDNASKKETQDYLSSLKHRNIKYIRNDKNLGFIKAHNNVFKKYNTKYFCVLNNDLIIKTKGWDKKFINVLRNNREVAQVGNNQEFGCLGFTGKGQSRYGRPLEYIGGSCFIVKSDIVKQIGGLFEEKYMNFAFCEDADLSLRLRSKGYKISECHEVNILHLHNQSFKNEKVEVDFKTLEKQNNIFLLDRWQKYFKTKTFEPLKIMINRQASLGDVFCTTPIIKALKEKYPCSQIYFNTSCSVGLVGNPYLTDYGKGIINKVKYDLLIDLDLAYEKMPDKHIVDAYAIVAKVILKENEVIPAYYNLKEEDQPTTPYIVICSDGSWLSRTYPRDKWIKFIKYLGEKFEIVELGSVPQNYTGIGLNYIGKLPLNKSVEIIKKAKLFVGMDGGLLHFAQAVGTPSFSIWGCTSPKRRIHNWGISTCVYMDKDEIECAGCHHDINKAPKVFTECNRVSKGKYPLCLEGITLERLIQTFVENFL